MNLKRAAVAVVFIGLLALAIELSPASFVVTFHVECVPQFHNIAAEPGWAGR